MKISQIIILVASLISQYSNGQNSNTEILKNEYYNKPSSDTIAQEFLIAVTDEEYLVYGARVAYVNVKGDTIIPFNKYEYLGTDTLIHFANVMECTKDSATQGRWIAIDKNENILYEIVIFDNGPDYFNENLVRAIRNGKMGFANQFGQIVIPCKYYFANSFEGDRSMVTFKGTKFKDKYGEHSYIESDEWFYIDKRGNKIE